MARSLCDPRRDGAPQSGRPRPLIRLAPRLAAALPSPASPLIGREQELASLEAILLDGARLVNLTGPGGVGKTRLALALAAVRAPELADGALFMPLAGVTDPHLLPATVAAALDLRDAGDRSPTDQVVAALRERDLLLVLDTFERLLPGAGFVADLVSRCPRLSVVVTSRSRLNLSAERVFLVQPLAVPNEGSGAPANTTPLATERLASVQLFVERVRAAASGFTLTAENMSAVNEICRRLDGLPLAIELAAVWIRIMPPEALLERLQQRLDLLTGGAIDLPPRLRSLREAIAWSHDLLAPDQQALFRRLSVFHGGFALDAAAHVAPSMEPSRVLPLVSALVDQSLLVKDEGSATAGSARFAMLDTIREFAHERLSASGEAEDAAGRHAAWFLALAERAEPELQGPAQRAWLDRLDAEIDNLRAALAWLLARGETLTALRFTGATQMFWLKQGRYAEGRTWVARTLAADGSAGARQQTVRPRSTPKRTPRRGRSPSCRAISRRRSPATKPHWRRAGRRARRTRSSGR